MYVMRRGLGTITLDPNAWSNFDFNAPTPPGMNTPLTTPNPAGPLFTCPTGEQVFFTSQCPGGQEAVAQAQVAAMLAQQGVCTCVNSKCLENGNDCESSHAAGPAAAYVAPFNFTSWINANSGLVLGVAGAFVALMFVAKAGR